MICHLVVSLLIIVSVVCLAVKVIHPNWLVRLSSRHAEYAAYLAGFRSLPKVEVHAHLGGSLRRDSVEEWLQLGGNCSRDEAKRLVQEMCIPRISGAPLECAGYNGFGITSKALGDDDPERLARAVHEYLIDCWIDGIKYVELRTGGSDRNKLQIIKRAIESLPASIPIVARLIVSIKRDRGSDHAWQTVRNAAELADNTNNNNNSLVVGLDFCGTDTIGHPFVPATFAPIIQWASEHGLPFVPHFAECQGEQDLHALLSSNPTRLGHCLFPDADSWQTIAKKKVPIECCLVSNINCMRRDGHLSLSPRPTDVTNRHATRSAHDPLAAVAHPVIKWYNEGHPFILCCDDVGLLQCPLSEVYQYAAEAIVATRYSVAEQPNLQFETDTKLQTMVANVAWKLAYDAVEHTFAPADVKQSVREALLRHRWKPSA